MTDTDANVSLPSQAAPEILKRIAASLGVSENVFFSPDNHKDLELQILSNFLEMINYLSETGSPLMRRRCIEHARSILIEAENYSVR